MNKKESQSGEEFLKRGSGEPFTGKELTAIVAEFYERLEHASPDDPEFKEFFECAKSIIEAQRHARANEGRMIILGRCSLALSGVKEKIHDFFTPVGDTDYEYALPFGDFIGPAESAEIALEISEELDEVLMRQ